MYLLLFLHFICTCWPANKIECVLFRIYSRMPLAKRLPFHFIRSFTISQFNFVMFSIVDILFFVEILFCRHSFFCRHFSMSTFYFLLTLAFRHFTVDIFLSTFCHFPSSFIFPLGEGLFPTV
jgi:hypothetical protein